MRAARKLVAPRRGDPRFAILVFLAAFVLYALRSPGFSRTPLQYGVDLSICLGLDFALCWAKGLVMVPLSGFVTSMGVLLLCDSPHAWAYAFVAAASILSKHLIRTEGRHVFNPNNFGIVAGLMLFPGGVTVVAGRWGGSAAGIALIAALGVLVAWKAGRLAVAASYVGSFGLGVLARHAVTGARLLTLASPMTGAGFQLFTFFMVTDPRTTPPARRAQLVFGAVVGALDAALRHGQVNNAPFLSLFVLSSVWPLLSGAAGARLKVTRRNAWQPEMQDAR